MLTTVWFSLDVLMQRAAREKGAGLLAARQ
jgi:hypothetical protein